jgi:hypothetical protein
VRAHEVRFGRQRPRRWLGRVVNIAAATCVSIILLGVLGFGLLRTAQAEWAQVAVWLARAVIPRTYRLR